MRVLERVTTQYVESEDRIRLTCHVLPDQTVVLWLSQRMLNRLLPHLLKYLERDNTQATHSGLKNLQNEFKQGFAQQAAKNALEPQAPVVATPAHQAWLVQSLDLNASDAAMALTFKPATDAKDEDKLRLNLTPHQLRQWLNIVYEQYRQGQWPLTGWPDWLTEVNLIHAAPTAMILH